MTTTEAPALNALDALDADGAWLVGGAIRDALAGDRSDRFDIDIAATEAGDWAARAARALDAPAIRLSPQFEIWRIPLLHGQIDVWNLPDGDIERDLRRRDFTVNAMAVPLARFREGDWTSALIDPHGGRTDAASRRLRMVGDAAFRDDPLRLLRAVRFEAEAAWRPDPALRAALKRDAALIGSSAPERRWMELQRILLSDRLPWALRRMEQSGLLAALFPELEACRGVDQRPVHRRDVLWHQIDAVRRLTQLTAPAKPRGLRASALRRELEPLLGAVEIGRSLDAWRLPLRLATLLHDIGKPPTRTVDADGSTHFFGHSELGAELASRRLTELRAPTRTVERVALLIEQHLRPGQINPPGKPPTDRALHRFHAALGEAAAPLCWLFLADSLATVGAEALLPRWPAYAGHVARILAWRPKRPTETGRILGGHAIMDATGLPPGPLVGQIRAKIDEAAAVGELTDIADAREMARRLARDLQASANSRE